VSALSVGSYDITSVWVLPYCVIWVLLQKSGVYLRPGVY